MALREGTYGLLAEFDTPTQLVHAAQSAYDEGYRRMDCYTPYAVHGAAAAMFGMETWISVWAFPLNIAGRPYYSWPAFVVPAYEWTILYAGLSAAFGMLALCGLPQLYHPLFNAPNFRNGATQDKFFLCLESTDPKFDLKDTRGFLDGFTPVSVVEVEY
jgi:hypothetical protein